MFPRVTASVHIGWVMKIALQGLFPEELEALSQATGQPSYRGRQLWIWLQQRGTMDWEQMTNLPAAWKTELSRRHTPAPARILETARDSSGTTKWLLGLEDGETVETVWIPARHWATVCLSTQVGCRMGCAFCASGQCGFVRSLSAGEIVVQFWLAAAAMGRRPDHVVYMGMGEPFDNYEATLKSVRILNHPQGPNVGARRITLSTSGIIPGIQRLAEEGLQVELSVSLHAADSDVRRRLMPIENKYPLEALLDSCREYTRKTKRFVTFEYTLIEGVNDSRRDAQALAGRLRAFSCRVNLIPLSPVPEFSGRTPSRGRIRAFQEVLQERGVSVTVRESKGVGVNAACGQLRRRNCLRSNMVP